MNVAWTTVTLVLLSVPGFLFVFAFYAHSRSSRDATPKSQLAEFTIAIGIAFVLHSAAYLIAQRSGHPIPNIVGDTARLFDPQDDRCKKDPLACQPIHVAADSDPIVVATIKRAILYLWAMAGLGYILGWAWIFALENVLRMPIRFLHGWASPFFLGWSQPRTYATAVTHMRHDLSVVAYRGEVFELSLNRDRNVQVLVLRNAREAVFNIGGSSVGVPPAGVTWRPITSAVPGLSRPRDLRLVINGDQILSLAMERGSPFARSGAGDQILRSIER